MMINQERKTRLNQTIAHILSILVTQYKPQKVILFGSVATDSVGEWSDIDLVIIKETSLPFLQRLREVSLLCRASVGVDYLVYTPSEFEQMITEKNPFIIDEVLNKGKLLYDRQQIFDFTS
ncbi:nucleotidyltransferase domain-containing protein [Anaerolineales bacterium HSG25]|nr:nucleotidyltransferase domain-containing protein [Anaerolineales bacterium HSG25]